MKLGKFGMSEVDGMVQTLNHLIEEWKVHSFLWSIQGVHFLEIVAIQIKNMCDTYFYNYLANIDIL